MIESASSPWPGLMAVATIAVTAAAARTDARPGCGGSSCPVAVIVAICVVGRADRRRRAVVARRPRRARAVDDVYDWTVRNNDQPLAVHVDLRADRRRACERPPTPCCGCCAHLRWPGVLTLVGLIGWRTGGARAAVVGVLALAGCGVLGFWDETMITLALMLVAVASRC